MLMIGITGVTGKLGSYVADLVDQQGIASIHLARSPERAKVYASAEIRKIVYTNTPKVVEALKGVDILLMVSARENPERVEEHKSLLDVAKLAGVQHIVYTSFYGADEKATFTLSRDHAQTEAYIKELGFTYTFLRDNFYLDFLIDMALENERFVVQQEVGRFQQLPVRTHLVLQQRFFYMLRNGKIKP